MSKHNMFWKGMGRNHSEEDLSRSEETGNAAGVTGILWVTSVRTDGPAFPIDSPKTGSGERRQDCLWKADCEAG